MGVTVGDVREGKGGKKYVYMGGDEKDRSSWQTFEPLPETKEEPSPALAKIQSVSRDVGALAGLNPLAYAVKKTGEASQTIGDFIAKGGYGAGGMATDYLAGKVSPETAAGVGYAANVTAQAIPTLLGGKLVEKGAESILQPAGRSLMRSALKPTNVIPAKADQAVETLLKEGINVTPGGAAKLGQKVSELSSQVDDIVAAAEKAGVTVNKWEVAKRGKEAIESFSKQVTPQSDVATIKKAVSQFLNHPKVQMADEIPVQLAHEMKKGTYSILGGKPYGEVGGASTEAQKSLARGLKEEIEKAVPAVAGPNAKQAELLNALELVGKRAQVAGSKNPIGLGALSENPAAAAAFALDRSELVKSILGRLLYSGGPSILGNAARLGIGGYMATTANE